MAHPQLLIFASGTVNGGGSGFENLVRAAAEARLRADIVGVVSSHQSGGVKVKANRLKIPFFYLPDPYSAEQYQELARQAKADFFALSGWLKPVRGLQPQTGFNSTTVFNIHPAPLPRFGGPGMYGLHVHEAVLEAFRQGQVEHSAVTMHFVTEQYDQGPVFFEEPVKILWSDTPKTLAERVHQTELMVQPWISDLVVNKEIRWDGSEPGSLITPENIPAGLEK